MVKLYYHPMSRASRVRWMLEEIGIPYEIVRFDFEKEDPEYLKVHPLGMVPAIIDDGKPVFESAAILMHLADKHPEAKLAPPPGTYERALYYQWILFAMTQLEPPIVEHYVQTETPEGERIQKNLDWAAAGFRDAATVLEKELAEKEFLVGGRLTAADVVTCSLLAWAMMMGLLAEYPHLTKYVKNLGKRPASKKARAD